MTKFRSCLLFVIILLFTSKIAAYKILALFPHIAKSHFVMGEALMKGLAARGHQVFVVNHFPQDPPVPNYTDISLVGSMRNAVEDTPLENVGNGDVMMNVNMLASLAVEICENILSFPSVQKLIKSEAKFDLIITELFNTDCMLGFVHKFKAPFIAIGTSVMMPWGNARFGNPDNPSYIPHHFLPHSDRMSFGERLVNAVYQKGVEWAYHFFMDIPSDRIARRYFGDSLPPLADIARNTSLLLLNTHFSLNQPRPFVPQIVEVGGLHLSLPKPLPEDIKEFLDKSEHGAIYFSLGSIVRTDTLAADKRDAFLQAFSELPQRVLWKWEADTIPGKPPNVKIARWLPQVDVLRHPNVKLFLTHGGLMGTIEAVHSGVPMVGIPLFGDQEVNMHSYISEGFAVKLQFDSISKESILKALRTALHDPRYRENAVRISRAFNDRPMFPLDTAIFWTEYVIRHRGAPHLRSTARDLSWYQYLLLDVSAVLLSVVIFTFVSTFYIIKTVIGLVLHRRISQKKKKQ